MAARKSKPHTPTFEEAAAELGEARPLDQVLRKIVKPESKTGKTDGKDICRESKD